MQLNLSKDLYVTTDYHFIGKLSPKSKHLLTLSEDERIGETFTNLLSEVESMEFFMTFSNQTKELLAKKLVYVVHQANAILLRQGESLEPPQAMFIILSGVVIELYKPCTVYSELSNNWPEKILRKGEYFGHVDILHGRPPSVDAHTVGYSELLMLRKEDFGIVSKVMESHSSRVRHYLGTTESVSRFGWSDKEQNILEIYSKLCTYTVDQCIYGDTENGKPFWSHFLVSGDCKILRDLTYTITESGCMKACDFSKGSPSGNKLIKELVEFQEVKRGYYCGVGEKFCRTYVVANSTVECLLIPRLLLVVKDRELLRKMASDLTHSLPSDQEVLDNYSKLVTASEKNIKMYKEMFKDKPEKLNIN